MSRATFVDTDILIDVISGSRTWGEWSEDALARCARQGRLVINPIVYAELAAGLPSIQAVEIACPTALIDREPLPYEAAFLAGQAFFQYRRRGGTKTSPLPDFLIGAHATVAGYRLLTRDARRYRRDFPTLQLLTPES